MPKLLNMEYGYSVCCLLCSQMCVYLNNTCFIICKTIHNIVSFTDRPFIEQLHFFSQVVVYTEHYALQ